ncbi:hypothetical protein EDD37DRAFT_355989 [Exophiala viscosa]|uniref:uncharacterized protein n=1 Tax=Exophiala viscosa TaxID=2486360 RepID=UPI00218F60F2|nr:hypothetical protein EDD37DRAFT_355989 [Exophiala viscosa]
MSRESQHTRNYRIRGGTNVFRRIAAFRSIEFSRAIARTFPEKEITVPGASELGSMLQILKDLRSLKCFDYRDKIWTIIILANDYDVRTLPVDYQSPWESVYTKVCRWLCNRHRNLSFLQLVETKARKMQRGTDQNRPQGLPSWVPLFHVEPHFLNTFYLPRHIVRPKRSKIYYAGGSSQVICEEIATSETVFKCKGLKIGVITVLSYPAGNLENVGTGIGERVLHGGEWQALARTHCTPHDIYQPTKENVDLAFERLRTGDLFPENARRSRESVPTDLPQPSNFAVAYADLSSGSDQIFIDGDVSDIGNHIIRATTRRRMFITDTGYMGLTHQSNLVGDEIWVLMGADMPVTLHPVSTNTPGHCIGSECRTFEFRGESYVHGIMDGEALVGARWKEDPDCPEGTSWLDDLGQESWPFSTEEIALI